MSEEREYEFVMPKTCVGYVRVSTEGQVDKYGISAQKKEIIDYCEKHDIMIDCWYEEKGISGALEERVEFARLLHDAEKTNQIEAVIVAKTDRVARDVYLYYSYKHELKKRNVQLISVQEDFGNAGYLAPVLESFIASMAQVEREMITRRTRSGRTIKAKGGGYSGGRAPFGYKIENGGYVIVEREAEIVQKIYYLKEEKGLSPYKITDWLNACGFKNRKGGEFSAIGVYSILKNRKTYEGLYRYGNDPTWRKGQHKAILPRRKIDD